MNLKGVLPETEAQTNVNFPDANLAAAVREALGLGAADPITDTALAGLTFLLAREAEIRNLTGLEAATNLWSLYLGRNQISDIRPLSGLTNLRALGLGSSPIRDIRPLSRLTNLTVLSLGGTPIRDISPLSRLTKLYWLDISFSPVMDLSPLSTLLNLETFVIDAAFDEENPGVLARTIPANAQIYFLYLTDPGVLVPVAREELKQKRVIQRCGLGWSPQSQYTHHLQQPKVMMYALEFEYRQHGYICSAIEIRTGDPTISDLDGWQLYLGTLYNPSRMPIELTQANSQITNGVLRLTPERLGLETFPCNTVGGISHPLPGVQYVLKTDDNVLVDTAYSCFIWGQNAWTTVNGNNVESQRRVSSAALREMEIPVWSAISQIRRVFLLHTWILRNLDGIERF